MPALRPIDIATPTLDLSLPFGSHRPRKRAPNVADLGSGPEAPGTLAPAPVEEPVAPSLRLFPCCAHGSLGSGRCTLCEGWLHAILSDVSGVVRAIADEVFGETTLQCRIKSEYSAANKAVRRETPPWLLSDLVGVRLLVNTVEQCYRTCQALSDHFSERSQEHDDYIARPKLNGYRSLHTVVLHASGQPVEIQVRTLEMHSAAEGGNACHVRYKSVQNAPVLAGHSNPIS